MLGAEFVFRDWTKRKGTLLFLHILLKWLLLTKQQDAGLWECGPAAPVQHISASSAVRAPSWDAREDSGTASRQHFPSNIISFVFFSYISISVRKQQSVSFHQRMKGDSNKIGKVMLLLPKYLWNKVLPFSYLFLNHTRANCYIHFQHLCLCERNLGRNYLNNVFLIFLVYSTLFVQSHYDSHGRFWV